MATAPAAPVSAGASADPLSLEGSMAPAAAGGGGGGGAGAPAALESVTGGESYTLNEPVSVTFMRDLRRVARKLRTVLLPLQAEADTLRELRDWDLWGPLLLCLVLSVITSSGAPDGQKSLVFASVFVLVWVGAAVVTLNAQLLGGKISFFQSVCVLGYCVCPLVIAALLGLLSRAALWRTPLVLGALVWSCRASVVFLSEMVTQPRRLLAVYPVALFYAVVAWMIFIQQ